MKLTKPQQLIYDMEKFAGGSIATICGGVLFEGQRDLAELQNAVNELYRLNDAPRIRIVETPNKVYQEILPYSEQKTRVLSFKSKAEMTRYAEKYAKEPLNFKGSLCELSIVILPGQYGFLAKLHHIISDAWTITLIASQLHAILNGEAPVVYSYTDYPEKEQAYLQSPRYEKDKDFFLKNFEKCEEIVYLSEKPNGSLVSCRKTFVIDSEKAKEITGYLSRRKISAFTLFMAILAVYINRVKMNAERFFIGTAVLNRTGVKEKNTMGMFVNTVPVLAELDNGKSFSENLSGMEKSVLSVLRSQRYNYGDILSSVRKEYGFTEKLYDVMLSYQNATVSGTNFETAWYHNGMQNESLQLHIDDHDREGIFRIHYDYLSDKFTEHEIDLLHQHMETLLFDAIRHDDKKIFELEMLTESEKQQLLSDFNDTAAAYSREKCVHRLFEEQVEKTPDKTAVIACDKTLNYRELNRQANCIAHALLKKGIGKGDIVAFSLSRKSYLLSTMLGILKSGAAYLPIDLEYPQERIEYMLHDSGAKFLITEENIKELLGHNDDSNPNVSVSGKDLCYCIYTSGSTGMPKGTLVKHQNLINLCTQNRHNSHVNAIRNGSVLVSTFKSCFDAFGIDYALTLLNGKTILLVEVHSIADGDRIAQLARTYGGDIIHTTPSLARLLCSNEMYLELLPQIKTIIIAAEEFTSDLLSLISKHTKAKIYNGYGPSECTVGVSYGLVNGSTGIHIGSPIANTQIYIVDLYLQPTPIGVIGELCIAGDGVGAGYLNRPELTTEKFVDNPFGEGKLYKTGDLAYWCEDGNIVYVGRNDFQVKIRGLRIELGEIENALSGVDGISQAVVIVRKNNEGRQLICAFYTGTELDPKDIRREIGKHLPNYMLPHIFTHLNALPLTSSGKVSRNALPEVDLSATETAVDYVAPQTEQEKAVAGAVEEVLHIDRVGTLDNFFDLGGDSLKAIELISRLEKQGYHTDTKSVFNSKTVGELAKQLTIQKQPAKTQEYIGDIPATPAQMRVYTAQAMQGGTAYNVPCVFRASSVEPEKLQKAVQALVDRHEILRTHFEEKDGHIMQVVDHAVSIQVEQLQTEDISTFIRPFDLSKAPLLRVGYCGNVVMVDMHHIITDGGSMPVFLRELNELYMGRPLETAPVPYLQYAMERQDYKDSETYWLSVYSDELPVLELNTDFQRDQKRTFSGSALYESLDSAMHQNILAASRRLGITPYVFYISGFYILLSKFSGNEDIVVGTPMSGRSGAYLDTIGMFVNTVALRGRPIGTKTVGEFLHEVKELSIDAVTHQDYPYGELVKKLGVNSTDRNPLFDVMFAYQSDEMTETVFGDHLAELLPVPITTSKYDFTFNLMPRETDIVIMAEYCTDLYQRSTMQRFIDGYKHILLQMLHEEILLKDLSAITEHEREMLLFDFNDTAVDYPKNQCVHRLFEEQVKKTPNKVAVIACDKTLTYAELNEQANRITHGLMAQGVKSGDIVAFMLPRKSYLIAAMFGILKAGAAYMPIDPDYPQDRIDYMVEDSGAAFLITEDNIATLSAHSKDYDPNVSIPSDWPCYCIYTSGSTGRPKGTMLTHGNVVNYTNNNHYNVVRKIIKDGYRSIVSVTTVGFDIFVTESILPLLNGLEMILADERQAAMQSELNALLLRQNADVLQTTPTKMRSLIGDAAECEYLKSLKAITLGGEVVDRSLVYALRQLTSARIFNIYGPTETTVWSTNAEILSDSNITIGRPIANTQIYIVDKYMSLTPIGVIGELCIAGDGVGAGYLNRPELTAEKFIDNPFGKGKLYKTGDLAYWREDGNIVYVGRNDFQVKIRGLRIELGEIENALSGVDGISQAVVVVRKNDEGRQLICTFYTGIELDPKNIRREIGKRLPKYMLPHIMTHLDTMPLTTNGKIDRKGLPQLDLENMVTDTESVVPETKQQKELCRLMEAVLGMSPVGITDDFFDLGGDSLKAIEFVSKAHNEGIYFNLQNVFDYPTVQTLCDCIENGDKLDVAFAEEDFAGIKGILEKNTLNNMGVPAKTEVGNILLAGATGYLGIHILADFLEHDSGMAYCLVRGNNQEHSTQRLKELLSFYFGNAYSDLARIKVICADLQKDHFGLPDEDYTALLYCKINTVINCAASVKHYGSYQYFYEVNVETTRRLIQFCKAANAKLIHTSTLSVSGNSFADDFNGYVSEIERHFYESDLYIGQPLENVYACSKFEAERAVLEAMADGLQANIMRMGNLSNRLSDGTFQKNHETNAAVQRIKGILELGCVPDYLMNIYAEFTPIDEAAKAVMTIVRHFSTERTVFHINSTKVVYMDQLLEYFTALGFPLRIVSGAEFTAALRETAEQAGMKHIFETFINDMDENEQLNYDSKIRIENAFTDQYLKNLGFEWSDIDLSYFKRYVEYFGHIGYLG